MEKKELEEKLRGLVIFTEGDGQGQATNTTLEEELGEYAMQKVLDLFSQELDRAREEGKREVLTDIWDISTTERAKDINWCGDIIAEWADNELSKLTTK